MAKYKSASRRRIKTGVVCAKTGSSRWTLNRWIETSGFPKPHKLGPSPDNIWFEDEVDAWIERNTVIASDHTPVDRTDERQAVG